MEQNESLKTDLIASSMSQTRYTSRSQALNVELHIAYAECTRVLTLAPEDERFVLGEAEFVVEHYVRVVEKSVQAKPKRITAFVAWVLAVAFAADPK